MAEWFEAQAFSGSLVLAIPVALIAGLVSFFSPCVIPLLPGYLSYATGISGAELADGKRGRLVLGTVLFVLGFTAVFVLFGMAAGAVGAWLIAWQREIAMVLGVLTIVLGLAFAGFIPLLQRDWRIHSMPWVGVAAAPFIGFCFGLGWTPCIGPTLAAIMNLSLNEATVSRGALLSGVYALGLGVPFILAALAYNRATQVFAGIRRHQVLIMRAGGIMMIVVGILLLTGWWDSAVQWVQLRLVSGTGTVV